MTRQEFHTVDVLRLEVQGDPAPGAVSNLLPNPSGDLGGWGWLSPIPDTIVQDADPGLRLWVDATFPVGSVNFDSERVAVPDGALYAKGSLKRLSGVSGAGIFVRVRYYDAAHALISEGPVGATAYFDNASSITAVGAIPAGAAFMSLKLNVVRTGGLAPGDYVIFSDAILVASADSAALATPTIDDGWVDILGPTHEVTVDRAELDLGTLTATVLDATLDPSQSATIRPGKKCRLILDAAVTGTDQSLFVGEVLNAKVAYDLGNSDVAKRARIQLTAVDQAKPLSNVTRTEGVAAVGELPYVFEGCRVPWNVNGNRAHAADVPIVVSRNENASAMDQVAITRDSNHAYAWFSREGVVNVWDAATLAASGPAVWPTPLDEDAYNPGISVDYDTDRCINHVTLKYLRIDPVTGETEEVTYGPYTDDASRARWGTHAAEFTVHGITEDDATLTAYAAAILTANATPAVRLNEATVPLNTTADVAAWALIDLYDLVTLANTNAGINEESRITRLSHRIEGGKWTTTYGFTTDGGVAQPQVTPSPTPSGGKTLSELLRPVGEVTMWYGAAADTPAGWLLCNGAAFSATDYPELAALLGGTNTPNMVDVFPIGAGTKAKGTSGGNPTKTIAEANLPAHTHGFARRTSATAFGASALASASATGTLGTGTTDPTGGGTPLDVMPPWRALYFIIRAR